MRVHLYVKIGHSWKVEIISKTKLIFVIDNGKQPPYFGYLHIGYNSRF